jgi:aminopeptidase N
LLYFKYGITNITTTTTFNRKHEAATADDLLTELTAQAEADNIFQGDNDLNVTTILKSWTEQSGYPYINVQRTENGIHISQVSHIFKNTSNY